jgi:hypothetical protein
LLSERPEVVDHIHAVVWQHGRAGGGHDRR